MGSASVEEVAADGCQSSYQNEQAARGEVLMSRDGGEHREDQAAEDQDEPEQKHKQTGVKQDGITGLKSDGFLWVTHRSFATELHTEM